MSQYADHQNVSNRLRKMRWRLMASEQFEVELVGFLRREMIGTVLVEPAQRRY